MVNVIMLSVVMLSVMAPLSLAYFFAGNSVARQGSKLARVITFLPS